jgi:23S rRNA pseudouridine2605 synthase
MEEKKKRPRLTKPDTGFSLKERPKTFDADSNDSSDDQSDRKSGEDRERTFERKPYNADRPFNPDRNREGGFERKPYQDRSEGGGGGYERKPYQDRSEGSGGFNKRPYDNDRPRPYNRDQNSGGGGYERKPYQDRSEGGNERRPYQDRSEGSGGFNKRPYDNDRPRPFNRDQNSGGGGYERKPYQDRSEGGNERRPYQDRSEGGGGFNKRPYDNDRPRPYNRDQNSGGGGGYERKPYQDRSEGGGGGYKRPYDNDRPSYGDRGGNRFGGGGDRKPYNKGGGGGGFKKPFGKKPFGKRDDFQIERKPKPQLPSGEGMPLNKYLAHCGISSRRKAVEYIEQGEVTVNGEVKLEPYYRIQPGDAVICQGTPVTIVERQVYVLLNKPKNVITTTDDERGRATVIDIVDGSFPERLYPVGRLDRDTTGLILITNDGDLAQKLSHPSGNVLKQYRIGLDRSLTQRDEEKIRDEGVELEDGLMEVNWIRFSEDHPDRDVVEVEISSGRNRVIRRLFEALGYDVRKLDRFYFAGLTKKDLPRGQFRELTQREIVMLKHFTGHPSTGKKIEGEGDEADDLPEIDATEQQDQ